MLNLLFHEPDDSKIRLFRNENQFANGLVAGNLRSAHPCWAPLSRGAGKPLGPSEAAAPPRRHGRPH